MLGRVLLLYLISMGSIVLEAHDIDSLLHQSHLLRKTNTQKALKIARQAMLESKKAANNHLLARSLSNMGNLYRIKRETDKALELLKEAEMICLQDTSKELLSVIYNNIGLTFKQVGEYDSAIAYFHKGHAVDSGKNVNALHNIGTIYRLVGKYDLAEKYLLKCLEIYKKQRDSTGISKTINNLGNLFFAEEKYKQALRFYKEYLVLNPPGDDIGTGIIYGNIGAAYEALGKLDSAFSYTYKALTISQKIYDQVGIMSNITNAANILAKQNRQQAAVSLYRQALGMADSLKSFDKQKDILLALSNAYYELEQYEASLKFYRRYSEVKDSLVNLQTHDLIVKEQEKYNASEREKEILSLRAEKQEEKRKKQELIIMIASAGILLVTILFYNLLLQRSRRKKIMAENDEKLSMAMLEAAEEERLRISQEIHDNLNGQLTVLSYNLAGAKPFLPEPKFKTLKQGVRQAVRTARDISHKLYANELPKLGLAAALKELFTNLNHTSSEMQFIFHTNLNTDVRLDKAREINLYRITQELINNTIKYAGADQVFLTLQYTNGNLKYEYTDNGSGFDSHEIKEGLGLSGIRKRVKHIGCEMKINSENGVCVRITNSSSI